MKVAFKDIPIGAKFKLLPSGRLIWTKRELMYADLDGLPGTLTFIDNERLIYALIDNEKSEEVIP